MVPETCYAAAGGVNIAYQVTGEGSVDVVLVQGFVSHAEQYRGRFPPFARSPSGSVSSLGWCRFDKRGMGLSDRTERLPTLEERMDDVRAGVMGAGPACAGGVDRCVRGRPDVIDVRGHLSGEDLGLVLWDSFACLLRKPGYGISPDPDFVSVNLHWVGESWGTGEGVSDDHGTGCSCRRGNEPAVGSLGT